MQRSTLMRDLAGAVCGLAAGAVALIVGQVGGSIVAGALPPLQVLGGVVILVSPVGLTEAVIGQVGTNDKPLLIALVVLVAGIAAALVGVGHARGRTRRAYVQVGLLAALPVLATLAGTGATFGSELLVMAPAALLGMAALRALGRPDGVPGRSPAGATGSATTPRATTPLATRSPVDTSSAAPVQAPTGMPRRQLLRAGLVLAGVAAAGPPVLARLNRAPSTLRARLVSKLPSPANSLTPLTDDFAASGASPLLTPLSTFYRIDTALSPPQVDPETWQLEVSRDGATVHRFGYDELLAMGQHQVDATIGCVSNEVGGDLVGTARWQGVLLTELLAAAGVARPRRLTGVSVDGWTASFRGELAYDGRPAMVAVGMNGQPLPVLHGFPARLVVPGLYGYTSATKWLQRIDVSDQPGLPGYWAERGWTDDVDVHIMSRIDSTRLGPSGALVVAGIAWAPVVGVAKVEVQVDDGAWQPARLSSDVSGLVWRQWALEATVGAGNHTVRVRATDAQGRLQDATPRPVFPSGATGLHEVDVTLA